MAKPTARYSSSLRLPTPPRYLYEHLDPGRAKNSNIHTALVCGDGGNDASLRSHRLRRNPHQLLAASPNVALTKSRASPIRREKSICSSRRTASAKARTFRTAIYLINYDIHWNPVRIIQRFGRIDRIGSRNDSVQLVNFWPVADLDQYLASNFASKLAWRSWILLPRRPTISSIPANSKTDQGGPSLPRPPAQAPEGRDSRPRRPRRFRLADRFLAR